MTLSSPSTSCRRRNDRLLTYVLRIAAVGTCSVVFLILWFLGREAAPAISWSTLTGFATDDAWHPLSGEYGLLPMLAATLLTSVGAAALAGPPGVASAVFVEVYAPGRIGAGYRRLVELLAGIPSVVIGLWGLTQVTPMLSVFGGSGQNITAAVLVLALMIFPTVALTAGSAIRSVPDEIVHGGMALGLNRWSRTVHLILPTALPSIGMGMVLALLRAVGETMAVLMVAGNVVQLPSSWQSPVRTITANLALELGYADPYHRAVLFTTSLLLVVLVLIAVYWIRRGGRENA